MTAKTSRGHRGAKLTANVGDATIAGPHALLVSNGPYAMTDIAGLGRRARLDAGTLGVVAVTVTNALQAAALLRGARGQGLTTLTAGDVVVDADVPKIPVGIDGETVMMPTPVHCVIQPKALRVRVPPQPARDPPGQTPPRLAHALATGLIPLHGTHLTLGRATRAFTTRTGCATFRLAAGVTLGGGHRGGVAPILSDVDPLARLRAVRGRLAPQMETTAQVVAERVITVVMEAIDLNAILARIDLNAALRRIEIEEPIDRIKINEVLARVDLNALLARVDLNAVLRRVDLEEPIDRVDLNELLDRVDVNQIVQQVDLNEVIAKVDLDAVLDRIDMNAIAQRIDVEALVEQTDLGAVIARSSSGIASELFDAIRNRTIGVDEAIARWVARLRRRPYTGPPGPPAGLQATAGS